MPIPDVIQSRLRIDVYALFIRRPRRQSVAAILQHEDVATQLFRQHLRYG